MSRSEDELYDVARDLIAYLRVASTAILQKELKLSYARAARIMDMLEENGVVSPSNGIDPRTVNIPKLANPPALPSISKSFHFAGDTLYDDAVDLIKQQGKISQLSLENQLQIGHARAARLMEIMEQQGVFDSIVTKAPAVKRDIHKE